MWHLPCPPLLLPMPILFIMPPSSPTSAGLGLLPLTSLCHVQSLLSTVPQGPFITLMPTYTTALDGLLTPPPKNREHSQPLIANVHYAAGIFININISSKANPSFKRHPGPRFKRAFAPLIRSTDCHSCTHTSAQRVIPIYFLVLKSSQEVRITARSPECLEPSATFPVGLLALFPSSHARANVSVLRMISCQSGQRLL